MNQAPNMFAVGGMPPMYGGMSQTPTVQSDVAGTVRAAVGHDPEPFTYAHRAQLANQSRNISRLMQQFGARDMRAQTTFGNVAEQMGIKGGRQMLQNNPQLDALVKTLYYNSPLGAMTGGDPRSIFAGGMQIASNSLNNSRMGAIDPVDAFMGASLAHRTMDRFSDANGMIQRQKSNGLSFDELGQVMSMAGKRGLMAGSGQGMIDKSDSAMQEFMTSGKLSLDENKAKELDKFMDDSAKMFGSLKKIFTGKGIQELTQIAEQITGVTNKPREAHARLNNIIGAAMATGEDVRGALNRAGAFASGARALGLGNAAAGAFASMATPESSYAFARNQALGHEMRALGVGVPLRSREEISFQMQDQLAYDLYQDPTKTLQKTAALQFALNYGVTDEKLRGRMEAAIASGDKERIREEFNAVSNDPNGMDLGQLATMLNAEQLIDTLEDPNSVMKSNRLDVINANRKMATNMFKTIGGGADSEFLGNTLQDMEKGGLAKMMAHFKAGDGEAALKTFFEDAGISQNFTEEQAEEKFNKLYDMYQNSGERDLGKMVAGVMAAHVQSKGGGSMTSGDLARNEMRKKQIEDSGILSSQSWVEDSLVNEFVGGLLGTSNAQVIGSLRDQLVNEDKLEKSTISAKAFDQMQSGQVTMLDDIFKESADTESILTDDNFQTVAKSLETKLEGTAGSAPTYDELLASSAEGDKAARGTIIKRLRRNGDIGDETLSMEYITSDAFQTMAEGHADSQKTVDASGITSIGELIKRSESGDMDARKEILKRAIDNDLAFRPDVLGTPGLDHVLEQFSDAQKALENKHTATGKKTLLEVFGIQGSDKRSTEELAKAAAAGDASAQQEQLDRARRLTEFFSPENAEAREALFMDKGVAVDLNKEGGLDIFTRDVVDQSAAIKELKRLNSKGIISDEELATRLKEVRNPKTMVENRARRLHDPRFRSLVERDKLRDRLEANGVSTEVLDKLRGEKEGDILDKSGAYSDTKLDKILTASEKYGSSGNLLDAYNEMGRTERGKFADIIKNDPKQLQYFEREYEALRKEAVGNNKDGIVNQDRLEELSKMRKKLGLDEKGPMQQQGNDFVGTLQLMGGDLIVEVRRKEGGGK